MSIIKIGSGGYREYKSAENWADENNKRLLKKHSRAAVLDHPDGSVTNEKLANGAVNGEKIADNAVGKEKLSSDLVSEIESAKLHENSKSNPHGVSKEQIGLGNVDNTRDIDKPVSKAMETEIGKKGDAVIKKSKTAKFADIDDVSRNEQIIGCNMYGHSEQNGTPSFESPLNIESVENPHIRIYGKNLYCTSAKKYSGQAELVSNTENSLTLLNNGDYVCSYNAEIPEGSKLVGKSIAIQGKWKSSGLYSGGLAVAWMDGETVKKEIVSVMESGGSNVATVSEPDNSNQKLCLILYANSDGHSFEDETIYNSVQLEIGTEATAYEPFEEPEEVILNGVVLRGLKDSDGNWIARDELIKDGDSVKIIKRCCSFEFDGSENWDVCLYDGFVLDDVLTDKSINRFALMNTYEWKEDYGHNLWLGLPWGDGDKSIYWASCPVWDYDMEDNGMANFKDYLSKTHLQIVTYYDTPTEIDISDTEAGVAVRNMKLRHPMSIIVSDCDLNVSYRADSTKTYQHLIARIEELESAAITNV